MTMCPLDCPQLSTTLEEESHRDPTWTAVENPMPPTPAPRSGPQRGGGSGAGWACSPEGPRAPRKIRDVRPPWAFLRKTLTLTLDAEPPCNLRRRGKHGHAAVGPRSACGGRGGRARLPDGGPHRAAPPGAAPPGRGETRARKRRAGPARPGSGETWRGAAALGRPGRGRGAKCGSDSKPLRGGVSPVRPQPRGSRGPGLQIPSPGDPRGLR